MGRGGNSTWMMRDEWLPMNILIFNVKRQQRVKIVGAEGQEGSVLGYLK